MFLANFFFAKFLHFFKFHPLFNANSFELLVYCMFALFIVFFPNLMFYELTFARCQNIQQI